MCVCALTAADEGDIPLKEVSEKTVEPDVVMEDRNDAFPEVETVIPQEE